MQRQELQGEQDLFLYGFFRHVRKTVGEVELAVRKCRHQTNGAVCPCQFLLVLQLGAVQCAVHILGDGNGIP